MACAAAASASARACSAARWATETSASSPSVWVAMTSSVVICWTTSAAESEVRKAAIRDCVVPAVCAMAASCGA